MNIAKIKVPDIFKGMNKDQIKQLIEDNIYNQEKKNVAIKYYVNEECMIDIADEYNVCRQTIGITLQKVVKEIEKTL